MTGEPIIPLIGNLTADPELRYTPNGAPVASFTVAATPRRFNRETNEWEDGVTLFQRCTAWREHAEHIAETLTRGMRVVVVGQLQAQEWTNDKGEKRTGTNLLVDEVGPGLRYATATVTKVRRSDGQPPAEASGSWSGGGNGSAPDFATNTSDPWDDGASWN